MLYLKESKSDCSDVVMGNCVRQYEHTKSVNLILQLHNKDTQKDRKKPDMKQILDNKSPLVFLFC